MENTLSRPVRGVVFCALLLTAISIIYPIAFIFLTASRPEMDYMKNPFGWPGEFTFDNFVTVWNGYGVGKAFLNSLVTVSIATVVMLSLAVLAAYGIAKYDVPFSRLITGTFVSVMLLPAQVLVIPLYLLLSKVNLVGELPGLGAVFVATSMPFSVFFLITTFRSVPTEVMEAAKLDGAGFLRTLVSVVLPMGTSGVATVGLLGFLAMWNELLFSFILIPDDSKRMLTAALASIGSRYEIDQTLVASGLLISASVPIILLFFASRYIMKGLTAGYSR
ncbi:MAG: carbohydrate ABC transporter permease [Bifidobacteriaceae bacterium]|jgi:ABC-type glycerol-3-phosphate transport system permease component|nr:carbohydrate ABC transporter permease [Bifidobacteriaceae bacterium]